MLTGSVLLRRLLLPLALLAAAGAAAEPPRLAGPTSAPAAGPAAQAETQDSSALLLPPREIAGFPVSVRPPAGVEWTDRGPRFEDERLFLTGIAGTSRLHLAFYLPPNPAAEPDGALRDTVFAYSQDKDNPYRFGDFAYLSGAFGSAPYLASVRAGKQVGTDTVGELHLLAGLTERGAYICELSVEPVPSGDLAAAVAAFLKQGLAYQGPLRDPEWTEEEVEKRILEDFPESVREARQQVVRTKHYIVLGNSSGAKAFGREIEEHYQRIQATFPFPEIEGRRLMPVYLFRNRADYIEFYVHITGGQVSREAAAQSGGHAWRDYYATHYESPKDPTHIHELTHQIFTNRLLLPGGGSWFQEGAAVFMETGYAPEEEQGVMNFGRAAAKKGEYQPFKQFMATESLLYSNQGGEDGKPGAGPSAGQAYTQAGTIYWFVMKDPRTKAKAQEWVHALGALPRGDLAAIEGALQRVYGVDIAGFEAMYIDFWKKPKK